MNVSFLPKITESPRRFRALAAAVAALASIATVSTASLVVEDDGSYSLNSYASVWYAEQSPESPAQDFHSAPSGLVSSWTTAQYGRYGTGPKTSFFGEASSSASFGRLTAYAHADLWQGEVWCTHHLSIASASFTDTLTVTNPGGGSGYMQYLMSIDGLTIGTSELAESAAQISFSQGSDFQSMKANGTGLLASQLFPVVFGQPFSFSSSLEVWVAMASQKPGQSGDVTVNYNGAATISGVRVYDNSGVELTSFDLISASGATYGVASMSGAPVPEPGSLLALGVGLTGFIGVVVRNPRRRLR